MTAITLKKEKVINVPFYGIEALTDYGQHLLNVHPEYESAIFKTKDNVTVYMDRTSTREQIIADYNSARMQALMPKRRSRRPR